MAPKLSSTELAEQYGLSYAFFASQPELMKLLKAAVAGGWTGGKFTAELKNTAWWKDNSATARQAQIEAKTDPATYRANLAAATIQARDAAVQAGAILTSAQLSTLATHIVNLGWNDEQIANFLGGYIKFSGDHVLGGQAGTAANQITQFAYDNGIKLSDGVIKNYAAYVVKGLTTVENVQAQLRQQAAGAYPGFAEQIQGGASVQDIAQPYIQTMAQELDVPPDSITLFNPKIKAALNNADDKGQPAPLSLTDFRDQIRQDPAWGKTSDAIDKTMAVGHQVLQDMGVLS